MADARADRRRHAAASRVPAVLFRLLQFSVLPEVLGASAGPALYLAAKRFSRGLGITSIQALKDWFHEMELGELEVELDEERVLVKLSHCLHLLPSAAVGTALCDFERGLIDGVLEDVTGTEVVTKETLCWGLGDTVCQFEGYSGAQAGYLYHENGFHPDAQRRLLGQVSPTSRRWRSTTCVSSTSAASMRRTTRSPGCTTSATCASTPRSSSRARRATSARSPS